MLSSSFAILPAAIFPDRERLFCHLHYFRLPTKSGSCTVQGYSWYFGGSVSRALDSHCGWWGELDLTDLTKFVYYSGKLSPDGGEPRRFLCRLICWLRYSYILLPLLFFVESFLLGVDRFDLWLGSTPSTKWWGGKSLKQSIPNMGGVIATRTTQQCPH